MRLRVLSDLHLEVAPWTPPPADADVVVLAGDIHNGVAGIEWAQARFTQPVVYVPGNHEYYAGDLETTRTAMRDAAAGSHVALLDRGGITLGGVAFLGCTLWTDLDLDGPEAARRAMATLARSSPDFRLIRDGGRPFGFDRWLALHREERDWLAAHLEAAAPGSAVVVTHYLPSRASIAPRFATHPLNCSHATALDALVARARLWIHGHSHAHHDHIEHGVRVVSNPRGYPHEQTGFVADWMVEI